MIKVRTFLGMGKVSISTGTSELFGNQVHVLRFQETVKLGEIGRDTRKEAVVDSAHDVFFINLESLQALKKVVLHLEAKMKKEASKSRKSRGKKRRKK